MVVEGLTPLALSLVRCCYNPTPNDECPDRLIESLVYYVYEFEHRADWASRAEMEAELRRHRGVGNPRASMCYRLRGDVAWGIIAGMCMRGGRMVRSKGGWRIRIVE